MSGKCFQSSFRLRRLCSFVTSSSNSLCNFIISFSSSSGLEFLSLNKFLIDERVDFGRNRFAICNEK